MVNKIKLRQMAKLLNIQTIVKGSYDLENLEIDNLDFLELVFERELE